jgi:hypothetical protein
LRAPAVSGGQRRRTPSSYAKATVVVQERVVECE